MQSRRFVVVALAAGTILLGGCQLQTTAGTTAGASAGTTASATPSATAVDASLYSPDAGFNRQATITVQAVANPNLAQAVAWWNAEAGRSLFVTTTSGPMQITIQADGGTCADAPVVACAAAFPVSGSFSSPPAYPYNSCAIYVKDVADADWRLFAHELGHCLGFEHVTDRVSIMNPAPDADNPAADHTMLQLAGY